MNPRYSRYYTYIQPVFKNKTFQTYGTLTFGLIVVIFFLIFAVRPTILTILSLQKTIIAQNQLLKQINTKADNLSLARDNYNNLNQPLKSKVVALVPTSASLPCFMNYLSDLAATEDATISSIQISQTDLNGTSKCIITDDDLANSQKGKVSKIDFTLNTQGSYNSMVNFLEKIERLNRLVTIENVAFNKDATKSTIFISISGQILYIDTTGQIKKEKSNEKK